MHSKQHIFLFWNHINFCITTHRCPEFCELHWNIIKFIFFVAYCMLAVWYFFNLSNVLLNLRCVFRFGQHLSCGSTSFFCVLPETWINWSCTCYYYFTVCLVLRSVIHADTITQITIAASHSAYVLSFIVLLMMLLSWYVQISWYVSTSLVFKQKSSSITTENWRSRVCWVCKIWWVKLLL